MRVWEREQPAGLVVAAQVRERVRAAAGLRVRTQVSGDALAGGNGLDTKSGCGLKAQTQERRYTHDVFAFYYLDNF